MNYQEWVAVNDAEKLSIQTQWNPYGEGYWHVLLKEATACFKAEFGGLPNVVDIHHGIYHGGELIIGVTTSLLYPEKVSLPATYEGFSVRQFGRMPKGSFEKMLVWYRRKTWRPR